MLRLVTRTAERRRVGRRIDAQAQDDAALMMNDVVVCMACGKEAEPVYALTLYFHPSRTHALICGLCASALRTGTLFE